MGLSDKGVKGIKESCIQHKCNEICRGFELENTLDCFNQLMIEGELEDEGEPEHDGGGTKDLS
ncbi:hypothetical protein BJ165DRAFT_1491657 [Panaeolus papilionaceus]|nr:hypothetical protein BJ165DRAFT_1491657 [Panaeolus papilionaceus]